MNFQIGDLVRADIKKESFPKGNYNNLKVKKIRSCKFLRKFSVNSYEIELPSDLQISPIFNVYDLYPFRDVGIQIDGITSN